MDVKDLWTRHPDVMGGQLVFAGTRVPVDTLFDHLASGMTVHAFVEEFPSVSIAQAKAGLAWLAQAFREGRPERWYDPAA